MAIEAEARAEPPQKQGTGVQPPGAQFYCKLNRNLTGLPPGFLVKAIGGVFSESKKSRLFMCPVCGILLHVHYNYFALAAIIAFFLSHGVFFAI